jgi:very-short-patch-repair endonuclease
VGAVEAITRLGGLADAPAVLELTSRKRLRRALSRGEVVRVRRGRYALPAATAGAEEAHRLGGVVALRSAALHHGWQVKTSPREPEVAVARRRRIPEARRAGVRLLWADPDPTELATGVTGPLRTLLDCARHLPFDEALAIADSALRAGAVTRTQLDARSASVRGAGAQRARRVLRLADGRAANPFESVLRAMCLEAGLEVEPQVAIDMGTWVSHPDLVEVRRGIVVEGDSHTFHTAAVAFAQDCERYNALVLRGWRVFRFTWEHAMRQPAYVRAVLRQLAAA